MKSNVFHMYISVLLDIYDELLVVTFMNATKKEVRQGQFSGVVQNDDLWPHQLGLSKQIYIMTKL